MPDTPRPVRLPLERFFSDPPITGRPPARIVWRPGHPAFTYLQRSREGAPDDLWSYDLENGNRTLLVPGEGLSSGRGARGRLSLGQYRWTPDGEALLLTRKGELWRAPLGGGPERLLRNFDPQVAPQYSPDGSRLAYVHRNDLWVRNLSDGSELRLTQDGSPNVRNGKLDWVYWEELGHRHGWRAFEWSPDSSRLALLRLDQSRVPTYPLVDVMEKHPRLIRQRYPKAGDPNSTPSLLILSATDGAEVRRQAEADDACYYGPGLAWLPDSSGVAWTRIPRDQRSLELRVLGASAAQDRVLWREQDPHWLNHLGPAHFLPDGDYLWLSERSGRAHVYRLGGEPSAPLPLTAGDWQVEAIHGCEGDWVYVTGTGSDPRERHLYRARLDGTACEQLTPEAAVHSIHWRQAGGWALVTRHMPSQPADLRLVRSDGTLAAVIHEPDPGWREFSWADGELLTVRADDGTDLYARLVRPPDFQPDRRYPVVVLVYGGPHAQVVRKTWPGDDPLEQLLAHEGILVWRLDNRGSWGRGHSFERPVDRRLGEQELADQLAGVNYLRSLPYVDSERIGITGWSYGGYMTLYAMTHSPETWRCGIAGAAVTDWKLYDSIYTERYMGTPEQNPDGYRRSSPLEAAEHLNAPLLLVHGTDDDNVHLQNTLQFVEALSRHRKPYELLVQPRQTHGFTGKQTRTYLHERMLEFFVRNLK